jgi:excisionase family DNA binding protein
MTDDELLTTEEAARLLKMHRDSIRRLIRKGKLPALLIGGEYRLRRSDLESLTAPPGGRKRAENKAE